MKIGEMIRDEAKALYDQGGIKASSTITTWVLTHSLKQVGSVLPKMV